MVRKEWGDGRERKGRMRKGEESPMCLVVLWMEAVVLAIPLVLRVTWPFAQHTCLGEISGSFYGDRVSSMSARGGGRRDCWSCTECVVLFLNIAEMRWWPGWDFPTWNVEYRMTDCCFKFYFQCWWEHFARDRNHMTHVPLKTPLMPDR